MLVWTCLLRPDSLTDMSRLKPVAKNAAQWWIDSEQILVGTHYRLGEYEEAIGSLERSAKVTRLSPATQFFAAMAYHRCGQADRARVWLAEAIETMNSNPSAWDEMIAAYLLRRETETLLGGGS
jgi:hypothetical protein